MENRIFHNANIGQWMNGNFSVMLGALFCLSCMDDLPDFRGPYLSWTQSPQTTVTITWESLEDSMNFLNWGTAQNALENPATVHRGKRRDDMYYHYSTTIRNLAPDTHYYYQVESLQNKPAGFRTAPLEPQSAFSFLLYGDSCETDKTTRNEHYDVVKQMMALEKDSPVRFVISSGDLTPNFSDAYGWDLHFDAIRNLSDHLPFFTPFGNHDWNVRDVKSHYLPALWIHEFPSENSADGTVRAHEETSYAIAYGDAYFVFMGYDKIGAPTGDPFNRWLEATLSYARQNYAFTFVDMHRPPFDRRGKKYEDEIQMLRHQAHLFHQYEVTAVFSGHNHVFAHIEIEKDVPGKSDPVPVTYLISGGGGQDLRTAHKGTWQNRYGLGYFGHTVFTHSAYHVVRADIDGVAKTVTFTVIDINGATLYGPLQKRSKRGQK
ncbi:MAG: metallophosphoesterase family protein [Deltaproteobacteria bacterium]|nr:metallophosphoesterase family protein [Deltaproteobacteria bacterium]